MFPIYAVSYFSRASFLYLRLPISYSFLFYEGRQYSRTGTGTLLIVKVMYCTVLYMYLKVLVPCTSTTRAVLLVLASSRLFLVQYHWLLDVQVL